MFDRVTIIGVGLLGASLGLAIKRKNLAKHIVGIGRQNSPSLDIALKRHAIDEAAFDVNPAAKNSDLVILCTPIRQFPTYLKQLATILPPSAIITDVGSTKLQVMQWAKEILGNTPTPNTQNSEPRTQNLIFIGSHPMAGSEQRGPQNASADLYNGALCFVCTDPPQPPPGSPAGSALEKVQTLWQRLGMRTLQLPPLEHDRWVAAISHLPHAVAFSLVNTAARDPQMLDAVAGGFIDTTRVASSDLDMWVDIFLTNSQPVTQAIDTFISDLTALKFAIAAGDESAIRATLAAARKTRDDLIARRQSAGLQTTAGHVEGDQE